MVSAEVFSLDSTVQVDLNPKSMNNVAVPVVRVDELSTGTVSGASSESNSTGSQSPNLSPSSIKLKFQQELMDAEATATATAYEASTLGRRLQTKEAKSVVDLLKRNARLFPDDDAICFIDDGCEVEQRLTYSQFYSKVQSMAAHIQKENLVGEPVLILLPPGLDYFVAFMGCLSAGAIAVPLYPPNPSRLIRELPRLVEVVKDSGAVSGITSAKASRLFKTMVFGQGSHLRSLKWIAMEKVDDISAQFKPADIAGDSVAFLQYSSGSTGTPKGVMVTHRNVTYNCWLIMNEFDLRCNDVGLSWLPPYHDLGLIGAFLLPICGGRTCYFMSPLSFLKRPMLWLEAISKFKVTLSGGPNFAYDLICSKSTPEERSRVDLSTWKYVFSGAEPVRVSTIDRFEEMFSSYGFRREHFRNCYGLAENTLLISMSQVTQAPKVMNLDARALEQWIVKPVDGPADKYTPGSVRSIVSCGRVPDSEHVAVVDPETCELAGPNRVGELWASGGSKAQGYWKNKDLTDEVFHASIIKGGAVHSSEWLRTGDLAYIDDNGEVFICGRLKDVIIIRGRNHFPQDIEQTVENSHRALRKGCCAAFSVEADGEEKLVISVETRVNPQPSKAELREAMQAIKNNVYENHGIQIHALNLLYPNTINKTTSGKIQRFACRKAYSADQLQIIDKSVVGANGEDEQVPSIMMIIVKWLTALLPLWLISYLMPQNVMQDALARTARLPDSNQAANLLASQGKVKPGPELSVRIIEMQLMNAVADQLKLDASEISLTEPLTSYGFDSMAAANFCSALEKSYGVKFPPLLLSEYRTVEALAKYLALGETFAGGNTTPESPDEEAPKVAVPRSVPLLNQAAAASTAPPTEGTLPCILGIGNANPGEPVSIMEMASIFDQMLGLPEDQRRRLDRICQHSAIEHKYSVLDPIKDQHLFALDDHSKTLSQTASTEMRNDIYVREAPKLAHAAAKKAIEDWGGDKDRITHVVSVSCTGLITPGLEFQVMRSLNLPITTQRINIGMMGCFGALSGLKTAKALAAEAPENRVLLVCCELCSLHFQSELDTETLVGSALFGDGAGAVVVGTNPLPGENPLYELGRSASTIIPQTEGLMTWEMTDNGLKMGLKPEIPLEIYKTIKPFATSMLPSPDVTFHDCAFPVHPGGKSIIQAIENACELKPRQTEATWEILRDHGNMSSATVLFILNKMRRIGFDVDHAIALAFGPGLNVEGMYIRMLGAKGTEKF